MVEFFTKSEAWQETLDPIMGIANLAFYDFTNADGSKVIKVLRAAFGDTELRAADEISVRQTLAQLDKGAPSVYSMTRTAELIIAPTPKTLGTDILVSVVLVPTGVFSSIPDYIVEDHMQGIIDGVLAKLFAMPKGWNDNKAAIMHKQLYISAIREAKMTNNKQTVNVVKSVKYGGL